MKIEIKTVKKKDKTVYHVIVDGIVANDYDHPTRESAERHKANIEAFYGGER